MASLTNRVRALPGEPSLRRSSEGRIGILLLENLETVQPLRFLFEGTDLKTSVQPDAELSWDVKVRLWVNVRCHLAGVCALLGASRADLQHAGALTETVPQQRQSQRWCSSSSTPRRGSLLPLAAWVYDSPK